jgi:hypothetical protein
MKESKETVGLAKQLVSFGKAIEALKQGKMVCREGWNGKGLFVFEQVPSKVGVDIIPRMTSLPESVKAEFSKRFSKDNTLDLYIKYSNQLAIVKPNNEINGWSPSTSDTLANDWIIL